MDDTILSDRAASDNYSERNASAGKVRPVPPSTLVDGAVYELDTAIERIRFIHRFVSYVTGAILSAPVPDCSTCFKRGVFLFFRAHCMIKREQRNDMSMCLQA